MACAMARPAPLRAPAAVPPETIPEPENATVYVAAACGGAVVIRMQTIDVLPPGWV